MNIAINELSVNGCYANKYEAQGGIIELLTCVKMLKNIGFQGDIYVTRDLSNRYLSKDYKIIDWLRQPQNKENSEAIRLMFVLTTKNPFMENILEEFNTSKSLIEFRIDGITAIGGGVATLHEIPLLSMDSDIKFCKDIIEVEKITLTEDGDDKAILKVRSAYSTEQIERTKSDLEHMLHSKISSGDEILNRSDTIFPYLRFCDEAKANLKKIKGNEVYFNIILRHLRVLNNTMREYQSGVFTPLGIEWSAESDSTLEQYSQERTFTYPNGIKRVFSFHTKIKGNANFRIFFIPDMNEKLVYIGYISRKLRTRKFKT